ncbi:MAG: hypothetical protein IV090_22305 [Candidatus Sericytochromatia bacterium]|nr:hypothetical protein [Candidatus Sericytochromatia bacterium]
MSSSVDGFLEKKVCSSPEKWEPAEPIEVNMKYDFSRFINFVDELSFIKRKISAHFDLFDLDKLNEEEYNEEIEELLELEDKYEEELYKTYDEPPIILREAFDNNYLIRDFQDYLYLDLPVHRSVPAHLSTEFYKYLYHRVVKYDGHLNDYIIDLNKSDLSIAWINVDDILNEDWDFEIIEKCYVKKKLLPLFVNPKFTNACSSHPQMSSVPYFPLKTNERHTLSLKGEIIFAKEFNDPESNLTKVWYKISLRDHFGNVLENALKKFENLRKKHELRLIICRYG